MSANVIFSKSLLFFEGGEVFETVDSDVHAESRDSQEMALRTADKLLKVRVKP